jgi:hypothetical protein
MISRYCNLVRVTWIDIVHVDDTIDPGDVRELKPAIARTYGKVLRDDDQMLVIAGTEFVENPYEPEYRAVTGIPKAVIKEIQVMEVKNADSMAVETA